MNNKVVILSIVEMLEVIKFSANFLIIIPKITGTVTTKNIFKEIPTREISFST